MENKVNLFSRKLENNKGFTHVVAVFLVLAVLALVGVVGWYMISSKITQTQPANLAPVTQQSKPQVDAETLKLEQQSNSDATADIEKDVNASDMNNVDTEMSQVTTDLQGL